MRPRSLLLVPLLLLVPATGAAAQASSVSYELTIESPAGIAAGTTPIRVRISGGVREAKRAAFQLRTAGSWGADQSVEMTRVADDVFETVLDTTMWENAAYRLEIRAWGDVPPYDPEDPRTFARALSDVIVDNAPATPERLLAATPSASLRVGWAPVPAADRADFVGYRVFARRGTECPADLGAYRALATTSQLLFVDQRVPEGRYCVRVAAVRTSAVTGEVLSRPSAAVRVTIDRAAGDVGLGTSGQPMVPPPPVVGEGTVEVSDGEFAEDLPYDPQTVTEAAPGQEAEVAREAGVDPRRTPTLVAIGLILAVASLLIRRFLSVGGMPA